MILLQAKPEFVMMLGVPCSTWVAMSRASTKRHFFVPLGDTTRPVVDDANTLMARPDLQVHSCMRAYTCNILHADRVVLALYLCVARGLVWCIEQPRSSLLFKHPRMQPFLSTTTVSRLQLHVEDCTAADCCSPNMVNQGLEGTFLDEGLGCKNSKAFDAVVEQPSH